MEQEQLPKTDFFTTEEWDLTPQGVKQFVVQQKQRIEQLENEQEELKKIIENLQEKVNCNSKNSSIPPSTEIVKKGNSTPSLIPRVSNDCVSSNAFTSSHIDTDEDSISLVA